MKFSTKEDIDAPIEAVFDMLSEFDTFERSAMRRGADVQRVDNKDAPGVGMTWHARFPLRGKVREVEIVMERYDRPHEMMLVFESSSLTGAAHVELMALSRRRTRLMVSFEMKPQNMSARLMIQSFKLAKASLTKRYKLRVAEYAKGLEDRYEKLA